MNVQCNFCKHKKIIMLKLAVHEGVWNFRSSGIILQYTLLSKRHKIWLFYTIGVSQSLVTNMIMPSPPSLQPSYDHYLLLDIAEVK